MKKNTLKYETVAEICDRLDDQGIEPTYPLVCAELDGTPSKTTVLKHIKTWKDLKIKNQQSATEISPSFLVALNEEIKLRIRKAREVDAQVIASAEGQARQAMRELAKNEKELMRVQAAYIETKERLIFVSHELDKKDAVHAAKINALEQRLHDEMKRQVKRRPPSKPKGAA